MRLLSRPQRGRISRVRSGVVTPDLPTTPRIVSYGDSITEHNHRFTASTELSIQSAGEAVWAHAILANFKYGIKFDGSDGLGRSFIGMNLGDTADTAQNMAGATRLNSVKALNPDLVVLRAGINDVTGGRTGVQILANLATIYNDFIANGIKVIMFTISAAGGMTSAQKAVRNEVNAALKLLSVSGLRVIDPNALTEDNGALKAGYSVTDADLTHFSTRPGYYGGALLASALRPRIPRGTSIYSSSGNLLSNGSFSGTSGAKNPSTAGLITGEIADSWRISRSSGTANPAVVCSKEGSKQVFTFQPGGSSTFENWQFQWFPSGSPNVARDASIDDNEWVQFRATFEVPAWGDQWSGYNTYLAAKDVGAVIQWQSYGLKYMDRTGRRYPNENVLVTLATVPFIITTAMTQFEIRIDFFPVMNTAVTPGIIKVSDAWFGVVPDPATDWS